MKQCIFVLLIYVVTSLALQAQVFDARSGYGVNRADSLYNVCSFNEARLEYQKNLSRQGDTAFYCMKMLAKCNALQNAPKDSVFNYLYEVVEKSTRFNYLDVSDCVFDAYRHFPEWDEIVQKFIDKKFTGKSQVEIELTIMFGSDQKYRGLSPCKIAFLKQFGIDSIMTLQRKIDEENEALVIKYFIEADNTIPSHKTMRNAYNGFMLVVWHASPEVLKNLKPLMKSGYSKGEIKPEDYAMYIDKLKVNNGKKQLYGTQYWKNPKTGEMEQAPMKNPAKLVIRKQKIGIEAAM